MTHKTSRVRFIFLVVLPFLSSQPALSNLTNGYFNDGLNGWSVESGGVTASFGMAELIEKFTVDGLPVNSTLSQEFFLSDNSMSLSFNVFVDGGETPQFTASLFDSSNNPLLNISGQTYFYSLVTGISQELAQGVSLVDGKVTIGNLSSYSGQGVKLKFSLIPNAEDYNNGFGSGVMTFLDNVQITTIPVPGALLLGSVGVVLVKLFRRNKSL